MEKGWVVTKKKKLLWEALQGVGLVLFSEKGRVFPFCCELGNIWCSHESASHQQESSDYRRILVLVWNLFLVLVLREENLKTRVVTAGQAETTRCSLVLLSTIPTRFGSLIHNFLQTFLTMLEKLIIRHLAKSLLKTPSEELTLKTASFLGDLKKHPETEWTKMEKTLCHSKRHIGSFVLLPLVLQIIWSLNFQQ